MEVVNLKSAYGIAKVTGVALCLAGVLLIAFFAGPSLSPLNHHRAFDSGHTSSVHAGHVTWIKGTFLKLLGDMIWSLWIIFQVCSRSSVHSSDWYLLQFQETKVLCIITNLINGVFIRCIQSALLKECPNKMLVTVTQSVMSTAQLFVVAVVAERDFSKWKLGVDVSLLAVLYTVITIACSFNCCQHEVNNEINGVLFLLLPGWIKPMAQGFVVAGACNYLQVWCMEMKGPVFLAMWFPLCFVLTIFCSSFFLGEIVHLGR